MSYSIKAVPVYLSSLQGDLIYTVAYPEHTSDPVTFPNFKFVADVYVGATMVARLKKVPDPVTSIGIFNIGNIVRNYIATQFNPQAGILLAQRLGVGEFSLNVTLKFGEEYAYTLYTNLITDSERTFFNNYNGRLTGNTSSLDNLEDHPLTTRPLNTPVRCDANFNFVPFLPSNTSEFELAIKTYDFSGNMVQDLYRYFTPASAFQLHIFNLSKTTINNLLPGMVNDGVKYYTVSFNSPNTPEDTTLIFTQQCECVYDRYTLHFLNKYGGFESKDFMKVSRKTISIEKKDFGKLTYTVDSSGQVSYRNSNNVYNESRSVYASQYKERMTLNSDFLNDQEYRWLQELVLSPMVYLEQDGFFFPVVISENNYEQRKTVNDELTNLTLSIEFGDQLNAQFR
ncbi:MAG: hypothetical protein QM791_04130 [Ferruginibacter sp.]